MEVTIRPLKIEDAYTSVIWRNDPCVFRYTGNTYKKEIFIENELDWIKKVIKNQDEYRCAIIADNTYVGNIYLTNITTEKALYHIFIGDKRFWGKGVAKKASLLLLDYAFNSLYLKKIILKVKKENERAYNLYQNLGFEVFENDKTWITMAITKEKYESAT